MIFNQKFLTLFATTSLVYSSTVVAGEAQLRGSRRVEVVVGQCPVARQSTGMPCGQYVPEGNVGMICAFETLLCECDTYDSVVAWKCQDHPNWPVLSADSIGGRTESIEPKPSLVQAPVVSVPEEPAESQIQPNQPVTVSSPTPIRGATTMISTNEGVVSVINNPEGCPASKPNDGDSCRNSGRRNWMRCQYQLESDELVNCDCNGNGEFQCRQNNALRDVLSF